MARIGVVYLQRLGLNSHRHFSMSCAPEKSRHGLIKAERIVTVGCIFFCILILVILVSSVTNCNLSFTHAYLHRLKRLHAKRQVCIRNYFCRTYFCMLSCINYYYCYLHTPNKIISLAFQAR